MLGASCSGLRMIYGGVWLTSGTAPGLVVVANKTPAKMLLVGGTNNTKGADRHRE